MNDQKPHNPDNLTPEQIGTAEGWRLLDEDEITAPTNAALEEIEGWQEPQWDKWVGRGYVGGSEQVTYRTRLTRAELRAARGLPTETEATAGDTPRTDNFKQQGREWIPIGIFEDTERELAKVTAERDAKDSECQKCGTELRYCGPQDPVTHIPEVQCPLCNAIAERDEARAQLAAARADSAKIMRSLTHPQIHVDYYEWRKSLPQFDRDFLAKATSDGVAMYAWSRSREIIKEAAIDAAKESK